MFQAAFGPLFFGVCHTVTAGIFASFSGALLCLWGDLQGRLVGATSVARFFVDQARSA